MIWTMVPTFFSVAVTVAMCWFPLVLGIPCRCLPLQRRCATDDLRDLLGDRGLALPVVGPGEEIDDLPGVIGGVLHRRPARPLLSRRGLHQSAVDHVAGVERQQLLQDRSRVRR